MLTASVGRHISLTRNMKATELFSRSQLYASMADSLLPNSSLYFANRFFPLKYCMQAIRAPPAAQTQTAAGNP